MKFFGKIKKEKETIIYFIFLPIYKCVKKNGGIRKYILGIRYYKKSLKNMYPHFYKKFSNGKMSSSKSAIFLAGSGAIAEYTVRIHANMPEAYDIFSDIHDIEEWEHLISLHKNAKKCLYPFNFYNEIKEEEHYKNKIFVLGNSPHHKNIFEMACQTKKEKNRWMILHEPLIFGSYFHKFNNDCTQFFNEFVVKWYPENIKTLKEDESIYDFCYDNKIFFIRPLINMTGIKNIICYSKKSKEIFLSELNEDEKKELSVFSMPLPVQKFTDVPNYSALIEKKSKYLIGSFGIPYNFSKRTNMIVEATTILNEKYHYDIHLLLAGAGASSYGVKSPYMTIISDPPANQWLALMNTVDLGIQLREKAFSFSSGTIVELLGLGKKTLCTIGMTNDDWSGIVTSFPEGKTAEDLALFIMDALRKESFIPAEDVYEKYSFSSNAKKIYEIIKKGEDDERV